MKRRILQLTGSFHQGGSERQALSLASRLKAEGTFEIYLATLNNDGPLRDDAKAAGFDHISEFPLTSFYNANFVSQVRGCAKYLRGNKIDLIHTHDFYTNVFGMAAATLAGVKARVASKRETSGMRSRSQDLIENIALGRARAIVANSAAVRGHLVSRGIPEKKISVIYNGIDISRFEIKADLSSFAPKYGISIPDASPVITLVANLRHDVKNIPMLLRAAKTVLSAYPSVHFVIAGEGELLSALQDIAIEFGVSANVHFIGRCTDVPELLQVSDICVLTSKAEGFSNSILEYMAAGKPVIATNVGGAAEAVVDGGSGFLVASDDDATLGQRLLELLADREKAEELGRTGRQIAAEKFSSERQLSDTIGLYERVLQEK